MSLRGRAAHPVDRVAAAALGVVLAATSILAARSFDRAMAAPKPPPPPGPDAAGPPTGLKTVPTVRRVRFEVSPGGAAVTHDLAFAKGAITVGGPGDPTLFVAFTAQARPLAIEATRHALDDTGKLVDAGASPVVIIDLPVRPPTAAVVLGPSTGAGHVLRVPRGDAPFGLRIRSAIPTYAASGAKELALLARLGVREGAAMPIERIEVAALLGSNLRGARAVLCGPSADPRPLTVVFPSYPSSSADAGTTSPDAAKRRPDDDLCVDVLI